MSRMRECHSVRRSVAIAFAAMSLAPLPVFAQSGIDACVNPAGAMRLLEDGDSCRPQERRVSWAVQGPQGPAGPQGQPGSSGPVVVDSTGARLGWYASPLIVMNAGGRWFSVYATRDGFSSPSLGTTFVYLTPDCSGQRYGSAAGGGLVPNGQVLGSRAWYADLDGTPVTITGSPEAPGMFWFQQADGSGPVGPCSPSAVFTSITLYPMRSEDLSAFVPPFRLSD